MFFYLAAAHTNVGGVDVQHPGNFPLYAALVCGALWLLLKLKGK